MWIVSPKKGGGEGGGEEEVEGDKKTPPAFAVSSCFVYSDEPALVLVI